MRVVYTDYSQYSTPEDYNAGDTKLANDILNGLYKPDIVIGKISGSAYSAFLEKGLFADYNTLAACRRAHLAVCSAKTELRRLWTETSVPSILPHSSDCSNI